MLDLFLSKAVYLDYAYVEYLKLIHFRKKTMFLIVTPKLLEKKLKLRDC